MSADYLPNPALLKPHSKPSRAEYVTDEDGTTVVIYNADGSMWGIMHPDSFEELFKDPRKSVELGNYVWEDSK